MASITRITDQMLEGLPRDNGCKYEIVHDEIVTLSPASPEHEELIVQISSALAAFVYAHGLGSVLGSNALYVMPSSGSGRSPDCSFIRQEKKPVRRLAGSRIRMLTVPDLVVEVPSPDDSAPALRRKVDEYLESGVGAVWVVRTDRTATLYSSDGTARDVGPNGLLSDSNVLPGFACPMSRLFR